MSNARAKRPRNRSPNVKYAVRDLHDLAAYLVEHGKDYHRAHQHFFSGHRLTDVKTPRALGQFVSNHLTKADATITRPYPRRPFSCPRDISDEERALLEEAHAREEQKNEELWEATRGLVKQLAARERPAPARSISRDESARAMLKESEERRQANTQRSNRFLEVRASPFSWYHLLKDHRVCLRKPALSSK